MSQVPLAFQCTVERSDKRYENGDGEDRSETSGGKGRVENT